MRHIGKKARNKDLRKVMCFQCHDIWHYVVHYSLKKKGKGVKYVIVRIIARVDERTS